ncbi:MAG: KPN_02809 family neutral zinc metallopeptidase [Jatrophihabitans sp.]|uniref:KPN_02809 family neutral zinc metallopeptidase n=1 Tax=Jatrophihabitans sp. TaxID=1932789 RepID=UPI003F7CF46C
MRYNDDAQLDTSEVSDIRGGGGGGGLLGGMIGGRAAAGGGVGILGIVAYLLFTFLGGGGGGGGLGAADVVLGQLGQAGGAQQADNTEVQQQCRTGKDANNRLECAVVADIDSIQAFWTRELPTVFGTRYSPVKTVWFSGSVQTGCGAADSGAGPFYCPADKLVYIDLSFYDDIRTEFQATGGLFVDAYVLAHEYGHHVQDLLGVESKVRTRQGANSDSVRLELQADCYAGVWAKHATEPGPNGEPALISDISQQDIDNALQVAARIGDDWIQKNLGNGHVDQNTFTHGSSAQRQRWFSTGYSTGDPTRCDTFGAATL